MQGQGNFYKAELKRWKKKVMKKSDKRSQWENEWSSAFEGGSIKPSERVWESIDASLANQEARRYKKKALFYQYLAAACFFLACCSISFLLLMQNSMHEQQLAQETTPARTADTLTTGGDALAEQSAKATHKDKAAAEEAAGKSSPAAKGNFAEEQGKSQPAEALAENDIKAGTAHGKRSSAKDRKQYAQPAGSGEMEAIAADSQGAQADVETSGDEEVLSGPAFLAEDVEEVNAEEKRLEEQSGLHRVDKLAYIEESFSSKPVHARVNKVWMLAEMFKKFKQEESPRYLLGANIASNYFNPNFQNNTGGASLDAEPLKPSKGNQFSNANLDSWNEEPANQPSINAGIQAAGWVGKKWVLQGGVQYGNYRSSTVAGTYVDAGTAQAYPLHYANFSPDKIQSGRPGSRMAAPVSATNTFEFISVPLRIGYVVIDKKIGLLLSPGISSEIFLKNQISDENRQLSTYTVYGGEDSPFNTVHFRGTFGAQVYYKLSEHYLISIEPNYQHSITDFNKEGAMFRSRPSNLGLSAGFRYIIR
jgi:hypothetical protein